ncbi:mitochondrial carrier domain-containing protein [Syncephalastrum racemosum]|uniref:Mitochondrial carrier domain-containing protein n=1 Tax=Syncephalastrum racemosum TaxID=13706 RepID=A0A1X2HPQ6_SYNRA|nr:mitochondrial carrier domain-containing protein [Syncephalastrum racemosum]
MTLTAYLSLLSLGSSIYVPNEHNEENDRSSLAALRARSATIVQARAAVVSSLSQHSAPLERRETHERIAGGALTIGTVVTNYALCFPVVVARHRLQSFPGRNSWKRDTPLYCARYMIETRRVQGLSSLYTGFGLGLLGQAITATYESLVAAYAPVVQKRHSFVVANLIEAFNTSLAYAINIFLYPFYRNALVLRVQSASTHQPIRGIKDFARCYWRDLGLFLGIGRTPGQLPIMSSFIPSSLLHAFSEKLLMALYKRIYRGLTAPAKVDAKQRRRQQRAARRLADELAMQDHSALLALASDTAAAGALPHDSSTTTVKDTAMIRTFFPELVCGITSSILTRAISYPIDTIVFKLMLQDTGVDTPYHYTGFFDCVQSTYREGGLAAFYPGWGGGLLEICVSYLVLETSWAVYRLIDWKLLDTFPVREPTSVRKARRLQERMDRCI